MSHNIVTFFFLRERNGRGVIRRKLDKTDGKGKKKLELFCSIMRQAENLFQRMSHRDLQFLTHNVANDVKNTTNVRRCHSKKEKLQKCLRKIARECAMRRRFAKMTIIKKDTYLSIYARVICNTISNVIFNN